MVAQQQKRREEIQMISLYNNKMFCDIYNEVEDFLDDYDSLGAFPRTINETNAQILYYLLVAKFGNSPIANYDENQFKVKLFGIIWQYGPTWEKRLEIQKKLRELSEDEMREGNKSIINSALNPETMPSTGDLTELNYINQQNTNSNKRSKLNGYADLWELLKIDVTENFLSQFRPLFLTVVVQTSNIYTDDEEE